MAGNGLITYVLWEMEIETPVKLEDIRKIYGDKS